MSKIYNIDHRRLMTWNVPDPLRKSKHLALLIAFLSPVVKMYNAFVAFREQMRYRLTITPQVCFLERLLNDRYDYEERRIYIRKSIYKDVTYVFTSAEKKPVFLNTKSAQSPVYLYNKTETLAVGADFVVMVPAGIVIDEAEFNSLLDAYKLPDKQHIIQRF